MVYKSHEGCMRVCAAWRHLPRYAKCERGGAAAAGVLNERGRYTVGSIQGQRAGGPVADNASPPSQGEGGGREGWYRGVVLPRAPEGRIEGIQLERGGV